MPRDSKTTMTTCRHPSVVSFGDSWSDGGRESISLRKCRSRGQLQCQKRAGSGHPMMRSTLCIKGTCLKTKERLIMSWRIGRQLLFLLIILKAADHQTRRERLQAANADQINALSKLVMNTFCEQIPILSSTLTKLRPMNKHWER